MQYAPLASRRVQDTWPVRSQDLSFTSQLTEAATKLHFYDRGTCPQRACTESL